jgi:hypothetical protein
MKISKEGMTILAKKLGSAALWTGGMLTGGAVAQKLMDPIEKKKKVKANTRLLKKDILPAETQEGISPKVISAGKLLGGSALLSAGFTGLDTALRIKDYEKNQKIAYDRLVKSGEINPEVLKKKLKKQSIKEAKARMVRKGAKKLLNKQTLKKIKTALGLGASYAVYDVGKEVATGIIQDKVRSEADKAIEKAKKGMTTPITHTRKKR